MDITLKPSYSLHWSSFSKTEKRFWGNGQQSFNQDASYLTKIGIVLISIWKWTNNSGMHEATDFKTVIDGRVYQATIDTCELNDRQIKIYATKFLKQIHKSK